VAAAGPWFRSVAEAQAIIEAWRVGYNTVRPHYLQQQTPAAERMCGGRVRATSS
jgi:transposase InsO family protein